MPDYSKHSLGPKPPEQPDIPVEPPIEPETPVEPPIEPETPVETPVEPPIESETPVETPVEPPIEPETPVEPVIPVEDPIKVNNPINKPKKNAEWFFATNTDNMRLIISQGLITSPDGFSKYYEDVLSDHNGVIPLFKNKVPIGVIDKSLSEENMVACIVKLNLQLIEGSAYVEVDKDFKQIDISDCLEGNDSTFINDGKAIYIPSPIPASLIEVIYFQSKDDRDRFKIDADSYSNVPLVNLTCSFKKTLFKKNKFEYPKPQENLLNNHSKLDYSKVYAFGGISANLFHYAKNGTLSNEIYKSFIHLHHDWKSTKYSETLKAAQALNATLNAITSVIPIENSAEKLEIQKKLYYDLFEIIRGNRKHIKQNILSYLDNYKTDIKNAQKHIEKIAKSLHDLEFSEKTIPEIFDKAQGMEKFLIMFFLRDNSKDLIEFEDFPFNEEELLILGVFFGCRDNFKNIPKFIRKWEGLQAFISTQMANYAHQLIESNITFKSPTQEPITLSDVLKNSPSIKYDEIKKFIIKS